ncbi:1012_t:CDS:2, partial [Ambispora gerdemannii]
DSNLIVTDEFVEDSYDTKQILLKSIIAEVGEENVREVWKIKDMRPGNSKHSHFVVVDIIMSAYCFANQESAKNQLNEILTPNLSIISKSVTCVLRRAAQRKVKYGEENEPGSIENSLVSRRKGRPETKRYKSVTEKKGKSCTYTCGACGQTGHNSVTCQNR